ncbi:hypothetical protein TURU_149508 [Turdus rufiventris]|nr:hypothetical protein TURU_149508 [Turdus rufiventris]
MQIEGDFRFGKYNLVGTPEKHNRATTCGFRIVQETQERKGEACEKYDKVKRVKEKEELLVPACLAFHSFLMIVLKAVCRFKFELMDETVQLKRHGTCDRFAIAHWMIYELKKKTCIGEKKASTTTTIIIITTSHMEEEEEEGKKRRIRGKEEEQEKKKKKK